MTLRNMIQTMLEHGLTQAQIAKECSCSQTVISLLYTGKRQNVKYQTGKAISQLYQKVILK